MNRRSFFARLAAVAALPLVGLRARPMVPLLPGALDGSTHETWSVPMKWVETPSDANFVGYYEIRHKGIEGIDKVFYSREWL